MTTATPDAATAAGTGTGRPVEPRRRWRTPTIIQMESTECGAAALGMVLGYHGRHVPLEELRMACGVSRDGARSSSVVAAARRYGLIAKGFRMEAEALRDTPKPVIVFWAFRHFIVVEDIRRRFGRTVVAVNDPAGGRRRISWEEFDADFTGVALTFTPGPDFRPGGRPSRISDALVRRRVPTRGLLPLLALASLLLVVPVLALPLFARDFVDRALAGDRPDVPTGPLLVAMGLVAALALVPAALRWRYLGRVEGRLGLAASARFFDQALRLPIEFFLHRRPAEIARRVMVNNSIATLLSRDLVTTTVNVALVALIPVVLLAVDPVLGAVAIAAALLEVALLVATGRARAHAAVAVRADRGRLMSVTFASLQIIESVKASGTESDAFRRFAGFLARVIAGGQRSGRSIALLGAVPTLLAGLTTAAILLVGGLRSVSGAVGIGAVVAVQLLVIALNQPLAELAQLGEQSREIASELTRLNDVERQPLAACFATAEANADTAVESTVEPAAEPGGGPAAESAALCFAEVSYGYSPLSPPVVADLSFTLAPGRRIAIVGGTGSGKSTIGRLAAGLYEPWSGAILVDGRPRRSVARADLAATVGYVDQRIRLFEGTLRDNLTLFADVPDETILAALRDAELAELVSRRPGGLHAVVEPDGRNFSGGERQRLELARALVTGPRLLVLDDATSAVDPVTEAAVAANLRRRGCGCLVIAHRLSTIRDADEILVLAAGHVVDRGTHHELLDRTGRYRELIAEPTLTAAGDRR